MGWMSSLSRKTGWSRSLVGVILAEQNDEKIEARRYMNPEVAQPLIVATAEVQMMEPARLETEAVSPEVMWFSSNTGAAHNLDRRDQSWYPSRLRKQVFQPQGYGRREKNG